MLKHNEQGKRKFTRNELLKIYSKELRDLATEIKKYIMLEFIKEKIELYKIKDFLEGTENTINFILELNKVSNLDSKNYKEIFELEQVFMYSILYTDNFKDYSLEYITKE